MLSHKRRSQTLEKDYALSIIKEILIFPTVTCFPSILINKCFLAYENLFHKILNIDNILFNL